MTIDSFPSHYELFSSKNDPHSPFAKKNPLKLSPRQEWPTLESCFGWSSTYIPYFDKINEEGHEEPDFEIVDHQDAEEPLYQPRKSTTTHIAKETQKASEEGKRIQFDNTSPKWKESGTKLYVLESAESVTPSPGIEETVSEVMSETQLKVVEWLLPALVRMWEMKRLYSIN